MGHFQAGPPEAALDIEPFVVFAAVEDRLVAARLLRDVVERLDEAESQLLALLVFGDGDVLDVADGPEIVDASKVRTDISFAHATRDNGGFLQLALEQERSSTDNSGGSRIGILNDNDKISPVLLRNPIVALLELVLGNIPHRCQHPEAVEEAGVVIGPLKRPQLVALGKRLLHLGGEVFGREKRVLGHFEDIGLVVSA